MGKKKTSHFTSYEVVMKYYCLIISLIFCTSFCTADEYSGGRNVRNIQNLNNQNRRVFFNDSYFFGQNGFFDVGDNARLQNLEDSYSGMKEYTDKLSQQIILQQQIIEGLKRQLDALKRQPEGPNITPDRDEFNLVPPNLFDEQPVPNDDTKLSILTIFQNKCASCHTEGSAKKITLLTKDGGLALLTNTMVKNVHERTTLTEPQLRERGLKLMPLGGPPLTPQEVEVINKWTDARVGL